MKTPPSANVPGTKVLALEGLRGLAATTVLLGHSLFTFFPYLTSRRQPYEGATPRGLVDKVLFMPPFNLLYLADAAVIIFFVLSGYVLTMRFFPDRGVASVQSGAVRRYLRLIVPAAVSVVFAWAILQMGWMGNHLVGYMDMAGWPIHYYTEQKSLLDALLAGFIYVPLYGNVYFNGPLWSIQIEFLGSMLLFASLALFGRTSLVLAGTFFVACSVLLTGNTAGMLYYCAIFIGALLHLVADWCKRHGGVSAALFLVGLLLVAIDLSPAYGWLRAIPLPNLNPLLPDFSTDPNKVWQVIGATMLVAGVIGCRPVAALLSMRIPAYLGRISYSVYCLHMPLVMSLLMWVNWACRQAGFGFHQSFAVSMAAFLVTVLALATLFEKFVDRPATRFARCFEEWIGRRQTSRAASILPPEAGLVPAAPRPSTSKTLS